MDSLSSVSLAVNAPWACLSDGLPSLGQEGGFMSYDQPSVPDFLEHYDGIPEAHEEGGLRDRIVAIR